jgi:hypothetical protein
MGQPKWQELGDDHPGAWVQIARVGGRLRIVGIRVQNPDGVTHDAIRSVPVTQLEAKLNEKRVDAAATPEPVAARVVLPTGGWPSPTADELYLSDEYFENPDGRGYGQEMYERVAMLYSRCVAGGVRPAKAIAEANGVPVGTVHRWIREARRRGVLAPARTPGGAG